MPSYQMPMLLRVMQKPELVSTLKRVSENIFATGGFIRKIENLGQSQLPYKASAHGRSHRQANHFLFYFDVPPATLEGLIDEYKRDTDVIRLQVHKQEELKEQKCTFTEEMLPPPYRPEVKKLLKISQNRAERKRQFKYNSGLDFYPFQR